MRIDRKTEFLGDNTASTEDSWLLGFGDLSTLLLCFFVAIFAKSPINPSHFRGNPVLESEVGTDPHPAVPTIEAQFESGTPFAISFEGATFKEFTLLQSHFGEGSTFSNETRNSALSVMELDRYDLERVTIETCTPVEGQARETDWYVALEHALSTRGQLIDSGIEPKRIVVSVLGPWCNVLGAKFIETKANLAGILRFELREKISDSKV